MRSPTRSRPSCSGRAAASPRRGRCSGPGPVLVMNAKVVADLDLAALLAAHGGAAARVATMLLRDDPEPRRWGAIGVDATGRVVSILDARSPRPPEGAVTRADVHRRPRAEPALLDRLQPVVSRRDPRRVHPGAARGRDDRARSRTRATSPSTRRPSATWPATWRCCAIRRCCAPRPGRSSASIRRAAIDGARAGHRALSRRSRRGRSKRARRSVPTSSSARARVVAAGARARARGRVAGRGRDRRHRRRGRHAERDGRRLADMRERASRLPRAQALRRGLATPARCGRRRR